MTTFLNVKNRASSTLASGISDTDTSLTVATGEGSKFPNSNFHITIEDEILLCTSRSDDTFTIERAKEETVAASHSAGAKVELRITAKIISDLNAAIQDISELAKTDGNFIVGNGTNWVTESGATARTSLGLGSGDSPSFAGLTVDTNTLYVDKTNHRVGIGKTPDSTLDVKGTLRLSGSTSGYVGLSPATAAGSTTYTLPSADGSSGQALTTNGSGTLSWATSANTALSNLASVAINANLATGAGTTLNLSATAPAQTASSQAGIAANLNASNAVAGSSTAGAAAGGAITLTSGNAARLTSGDANGGNIYLTTGSGIGTGTYGNVIIVQNGGNVGIGTTGPTAKLHVVSNDAFPHAIIAAGSGAPYGAFLSLNATAITGGKDWFIFSTGGSAGEGTGKLVFKNQTDGVFGLTIQSNGNVGIGTTSPNAAALLDVSSTAKGFLPPRMTTTQRDAISSPPAGLIVYNSSTNKLNLYNGSGWKEITSAA